MMEKDKEQFMTKKCFYDGTHIQTFLNYYLEYIWKLVQLQDNKKKYPNAYTNIYLMKHIKVAKKTNFLLETIEQNQRFIKTTDKCVFDNGEKLYSFWFKHKEFIHYMTKLDYYQTMYPTACKIIDEKYNMKQYTLEEKCLSYFQIINTKGHLLKHYDKTRLVSGAVASVFARDNFDTLYQMINEDKNKSKYPIAYKLLKELKIIKEKNKEKLSIKERCLEYYQIVEKKEKRLGYKLIKEEYERKQLTYDDKIMEYINLVDKNGTILSKRNDLTFSDGKKVNSFWGNHRQDIVIKFCDEKIRKQYPKACLILQRSYYHDAFLRIRLNEYLALVEKNNCLMTNDIQLLFSDQTTVYGFAHHHRNYIKDEVETEVYQNKYPEACDLILKSKVKSKL